MEEFNRFHNRLRILMNIDADEFFGAIHPDLGGDPTKLTTAHWDKWEEFARNPHRWFIRAPDDQAKALWTLIKGREETRARVA